MDKKDIKKYCDCLFSEYPNVIGAAILELDCGCAKIGGFNKKGDQCTPLHSIMTGSVVKDKEAEVCLKCLIDGGSNPNRVIKNYILLIANTLNEEEITTIRKKAFGA